MGNVEETRLNVNRKSFGKEFGIGSQKFKRKCIKKATKVVYMYMVFFFVSPLLAICVILYVLAICVNMFCVNE